MPKKNTSIRVDLNKLYLYAKEKKIHLLIILALALSVRLDMGVQNGKFAWKFSCNPLTVQDLKYLLGD